MWWIPVEARNILPFALPAVGVVLMLVLVSLARRRTVHWAVAATVILCMVAGYLAWARVGMTRQTHTRHLLSLPFQWVTIVAVSPVFLFLAYIGLHYKHTMDHNLISIA